jgi:hypothetical protein
MVSSLRCSPIARGSGLRRRMARRRGGRSVPSRKRPLLALGSPVGGGRACLAKGLPSDNLSPSMRAIVQTVGISHCRPPSYPRSDRSQ